MPIATEIAVLTLQPGASVEDATSPAGQKWKEIRSDIATKKGCLAQYWGVMVEDPTRFVWTLDWEDVSDHHNYMQSEEYKPFIANAAAIFDWGAGAVAWHTALTADAKAAREAPVTEFARFMIPLEASEEQKSAVEDGVLNVAQCCVTASTAKTFATGWVMEEAEHDKAPEGKAMVFQALIGWPSVEDHMKLREEKVFVETVTPVRGMLLPPKPGVPANMFHAKLSKV